MKYKHKITFAGRADALAVALAQMGQSNSVIERDTKLTSSQITYRLSKAKGLMQQEHGFRVAWRRGESPICKKLKGDMLAILTKDVQRNLPVQIEHMPGEVAKK